MRKKICAFTGTRAEYGLLMPLLNRIRKEKTWQLQLLVSGTHLSSEFGSTYREIEKDGFKISEKVRNITSSDSAEGVSKSIGIGVIGYSQALTRLKPDLVIILGDRFEALAAAISALIAKIPIAHINGGEATYGLFDESIRHAITKMSFFHFVSTEEYRKRVIQLGEDPKRVFNVGATGIDNIREMRLLTKAELEKSLNFSLGEKSVLVTFHPVTLEHNTAGSQVTELLNALNHFKGLRVIFTKPNADTDGRTIIRLMEAYAAQNPDKAEVFSSLGQLKYLSCLKHVQAVVGNSSSGIIEAPSLKVPTVNIGNRQKGRIAAESVINCNPSEGSIVKALNLVFSPGFRKLCGNVRNPYGNGYAAGKIYKILSQKVKEPVDISKSFYDVRIK